MPEQEGNPETTTPLRVGIVGAGFMAGTHSHAYRLLTDLNVEIVGVAATRLEHAQALAERYAISAAYDDYRHLLDRKDIDLIDLCVPNDLHEPLTVAAANAGKHVVCEKPLTGYFGGPTAHEPVGNTPKRIMLAEALASADRMLDAVHRAGTRLMYAENWLYSPAVQKANRLIGASGGVILEMRASECHSGSRAAYAKSWRTSGGGALLRLGAHPIGALLYLKQQEGLRRDNNPITVCSVSVEVADLTKAPAFQAAGGRWLVDDWQDVENWCAVLLGFTDGTRASVFASDIALGGMEDSLDILMSNGRVKCDMTHATMLQAYAPDADVFGNEYLAEKLETNAGWSYPSIDEGWLLGYDLEIRDFVLAIQGNRPVLSTPELGREVLRVIYTAYLAAEEERKVYL